MGKKTYVLVLVPKEYQASYDRATAWLSTPEFAVWKNEIYSRLGKFDATLQKAEELSLLAMAIKNDQQRRNYNMRWYIKEEQIPDALEVSISNFVYSRIEIG